MSFVYFGHETVPWFSLFCWWRNLWICLVGQMDVLSVALNLHPSAFFSFLRILYRIPALFSLSFSLVNICIFLEWCRCFLYNVLICLYSIRSSCCLDLIHLFSANLLWVLSFCESWSNQGLWSCLFLSLFSVRHVYLLSFYGISVIIVIFVRVFSPCLHQGCLSGHWWSFPHWY